MYQQTIKSSMPALIVFLIDESKSMQAVMAGQQLCKIEGLATSLNGHLRELLIMCETGDDEPRPYFEVALIGYTTTKANEPRIRPAWQGGLAGRDIVRVADLNREPLEHLPRPIWYRPPAREDMHGTPMAAALRHVRDLVCTWCDGHKESFPPIVIHMTDGEAFGGDPEPAARELKEIATRDGGVLLFNYHLSSAPAAPVLFAAHEDHLPGDGADDSKFARSLFRMSSELPESLASQARVNGLDLPEGARGMAFNANYFDLTLLMSVGTPAYQMLR